MSKTIFTKIIEGEIPSFQIYENPYVFAFLDINPINLGHTLIVPKIAVDYFPELEEPFYSEIFKAAKQITPAIDAATGCVRVGTMIAGWDVPHFHYHLVPMFAPGDLDFKKASPATNENLAEMQKKILKHLSS